MSRCAHVEPLAVLSRCSREARGFLIVKVRRTVGRMPSAYCPEHAREYCETIGRLPRPYRETITFQED